MTPAQAGRAQDRARLRRVVVPGAVTTLLVGGALFYIGSLRYSIPEVLLVLLLGGAAGTLAWWAVVRTADDMHQAYWVSTPREEAVPPAALDYRLVRLRRDLRDAVERDDRSDDIYPVIRELTAERLRAHHDIDLDADPQRAQQIIDPHLWRYLASPPTDTRKRSKSSLYTAIEGVERL